MISRELCPSPPSLAVSREMSSPASRVVNGRYEIQGRLGLGGMGVVWRARDLRSGRGFALKQPRTARDLGTDAAGALDPAMSLVREHAALSCLSHINIVRAHDFDLDEGDVPFLVIDLVEDARTIVEEAKTAGHLGRLDLLRQLFGALSHVHGAGFLHGDVKPDNVLVTPGRSDRQASVFSPVVQLIDFGICVGSPGAGPCASSVGDNEAPASSRWPVGSWLYLAPEQLRGEPLVAASDLYAAGIITAQVWTGLGLDELLRGVRGGPVRPVSVLCLPNHLEVLGVDARICTLLRRLLSASLRHRFQSADQVLDALDEFRTGLG